MIEYIKKIIKKKIVIKRKLIKIECVNKLKH